MPSNTAASMFGGAGGRGSRASVASLQGLRNVLRNETEKDSAPAAPPAPKATPADAAASDAPAGPLDDKKTMRGLNDRLSDYVNRVKKMENENLALENEIDGIMAKRKTPEGRDWDKVERPLNDLKKQIKDITMDNARLLLQADNTKLANEDFKKKVDDETRAEKELENDLQDLKKIAENTKLNHKQTQKEIDLVKEEISRLKQEHKEEVDVLREKVKVSEVKVEMESQRSDLAELVNNIRYQYDKVVKKNLKDTEEWFQSKFENIKVTEAQNNEHLNSGKSELKELLVQKRSLEIKIQSLQSKIYNLEEALNTSKVENSHRLGSLNQAVLHLEAELKKVRAKLEHQADTNKDLLCVKMKLEVEMDNYQEQLQSISPEAQSLDFPLEAALHSDQQKPDDEVAKQKWRVEDEPLVKQACPPADKATPPKVTPPKAPEEEGHLV